MAFLILALPYQPFAALFWLDDEALAERRARRMIAEAGMPCRVSLDDVAPGERVILINHVYQPADTPFHASHAIFVRENAIEAVPRADEIPPALHRRMLSLRAFDDEGMILTAELCAGHDAAPVITSLLDRPEIDHVDLHYAAYGCYGARAVRDTLAAPGERR